ncbi:hypothetical protein [Planctomicrobium sp. SH527]|uniref:hypothetical protein n=1 Tax=Planctomicrobium sp. SH527 TaxID=3448123 RepID=UPI003F5B76C3
MKTSFLAVSLMCLALVGCGGGATGPDEHVVSGNVTFNGEPIENGRILLRQTEGSQQAFSGEIKNGSYSLKTAPGKMHVEITASRIIPGKFDNSNGTPEPVGEMYIPAKYNSKSDLTADVVGGQKNTFDFALTSK